MQDFINNMPLWGVILTTIVSVWLATEVGFQAGLSSRRKSGFDNETHITSITGAHLGLLAFLLAFTFSMAANHYDSRKQVIWEDASAIKTAYARAALIAGPQSDKIRVLLRQYTAVRSEVGDRRKLPEIIRESESLQTQMWQQVQALVAARVPSVMESLLVQSMNRVFEIHELRISAGKRNNIPPSIWVSLYAVLLLSMVGMGFHSGIKGSRSPIPSAALALSFSMVLFLIADLERPNTGLVRADHAAIIELNEKLKQSQE